MKTTYHVFSAAHVFTLATLAALTGCANVPTRQSTLDTSYTANFARAAEGNLELPRPLHTVPPEFPLDMRRNGNSGIVNLTCRVDDNGDVHDVRVENASDPAFSRPAVDALRQWTFKPGMREGSAVSMRVGIPIRFTYDDK